MGYWRKRVFWLLALVVGIAMLSVGSVTTSVTPPVGAVYDPGLISVPDVYSFVPSEWAIDDVVTGVFLTRATKYGATYHGSVTADKIIEDNKLNNFDPTYTAMVKHNDVWENILPDGQGQYTSPFRIAIDSDKRGVIWYLDADAPAAVYGVKCTYQDPNTLNVYEGIFNVVYTDKWTYLSLHTQAGANYVTDFRGGVDRTLTVQVAFNDGATTPTFEPINQEIDDSGVTYGAIRASETIAIDSLQFTLKTVSGEIYDGNISAQRLPNTNCVTLMFEDSLANDTYVLQVASAVDGKIYGALVINNAGGAASINLSRLWIFLMAGGGVLVLVAAGMFFLPLVVAKVNANRVYKENARVARMKNPEAYANKSGTLFQRIQSKLQNWANRKKKGAVTKVTEEEKPQEESAPAPAKPKFTDMLRERREKRDFVGKGGESSETKSGSATTEKLDEKQSFAFLRNDDDDEIASFHQEKKEAPTIETGSYVEDGVTFAKLDSLRDENDENKQ